MPIPGAPIHLHNRQRLPRRPPHQDRKKCGPGKAASRDGAVHHHSLRTHAAEKREISRPTSADSGPMTSTELATSAKIAELKPALFGACQFVRDPRDFLVKFHGLIGIGLFQ